MNIILGISAAGGIGIGQAFVIPEDQQRIIPNESLRDDQLDDEWKRLETSISRVQQQFAKELSALEKGNVQRVIFETYQMMLSDPVFIGEVKQDFYEKQVSIESVLDYKYKEYAQRLRNSGNDYLAERAKDIEDIFAQVLDDLTGYHPFNIEQVKDGSVIVARNLKTNDTIILSKRKIAGIVLTEGGISSHVAILAKSFGIPAVVGVEDVAKHFTTGEKVIVDGNAGKAITSPDQHTLTDYQIKIEEENKNLLELQKLKDIPAQTEDGTRFYLYANIGTVEEAVMAQEAGADGIGLFRTEFLFMDKINNNKSTSSVSEEEQFQSYKQVLQIMGDKPVTIRTLDAGGDKFINTKDNVENSEKNPLMGLRAIRLSLYNPQLLRTQLRALYRASVYGNLRIMLPLITEQSQIETILGIADNIKLELKSQNIPYKDDVPIGIMVETAAAAICADCLAPSSKFFSIGTNDLTQYILGIDRENAAVAPLYNEFHLAVLRMIKNTINCAAAANIPVSVCGEMAGRKESAIILAGMGIRSLSMTPKQIPVIKKTLSQFTRQELENLCRRSLY